MSKTTLEGVMSREGSQKEVVEENVSVGANGSKMKSRNLNVGDIVGDILQYVPASFWG